MARIGSWLPRKEVLLALSDKEWHNFAEILGKCGDCIQHERATRLYMAAGAGRKKTEDGQRPPVSLDEIQSKTGFDLAEIIRRGRRRGISNVMYSLTKEGFVECKDESVEIDLREYRCLDPEAQLKKASAAIEPPSDSVEEEMELEEESEPEPKPERKPRRKKDCLKIPDEGLDAIERTPRVQFELPQEYKDVLEFIEIAESEFLKVLGPTTTNGEKNDFFRATRSAKRVIQANVFAPTLPVPAPALPPPPAMPTSLPMAAPTPSFVPIAGGATE